MQARSIQALVRRLSVRSIAAATLFGVVAFALGGCSAMRLAYDYADDYFVGVIQDYFDPTPEQLRVVRANADRLLVWHRQHELPLYAALLDQAALKIRKGLAVEDVDWGVTQVRARYDALARQIVDANAPLLSELSATNLAALETKFASENAEIERTYLEQTPARRDQRRVERVQRQLERWIGALDANQRGIVAAWVAAAPSASMDWYRERIQRQQALLALLREKPDAALLAARVADLWIGRAAAANPRPQSRIGALIVSIDQTLSAAQRERAVLRMKRYADEFRSLIQ